MDSSRFTIAKAQQQVQVENEYHVLKVLNIEINGSIRIPIRIYKDIPKKVMGDNIIGYKLFQELSVEQLETFVKAEGISVLDVSGIALTHSDAEVSERDNTLFELFKLDQNTEHAEVDDIFDIVSQGEINGTEDDTYKRINKYIQLSLGGALVLNWNIFDEAPFDVHAGQYAMLQMADPVTLQEVLSVKLINVRNPNLGSEHINQDALAKLKALKGVTNVPTLVATV
jgi:hypothetical protein